LAVAAPSTACDLLSINEPVCSESEFWEDGVLTVTICDSFGGTHRCYFQTGDPEAEPYSLKETCRAFHGGGGVNDAPRIGDIL